MPRCNGQLSKAVGCKNNASCLSCRLKNAKKNLLGFSSQNKNKPRIFARLCVVGKLYRQVQ